MLQVAIDRKVKAKIPAAWNLKFTSMIDRRHHSQSGAFDNLPAVKLTWSAFPFLSSADQDDPSSSTGVPEITTFCARCSIVNVRGCPNWLL